MVKIVVIGAGVVGLATAVNIQNRVPNSQVTVIADKFGKDTTSNGAGGLIRPTYLHIKGDRASVRRWCKASWDYFSGLIKTGKSSESGVFSLDGYYLTQDLSDDELCKETILNVRLMSEEEKRKKGFQQRYCYAMSTLGVSPAKYLPFLLQQFRENGGTVINRTVHSLRELVNDYDIVVTCCGLRARELLNDETVFPVRGQLIRVYAPWIKHWYMKLEDDTYLIPQFNGELVLGGCRQRGNYSMELDENLQAQILRRCEELVPEIKGAKIISNWVGLRPTREPIRIEKELMNFGGKKLRVVHNYGHGANGISLSWGTAVDASELVNDYAKEMRFSSKL